MQLQIINKKGESNSFVSGEAALFSLSVIESHFHQSTLSEFTKEHLERRSYELSISYKELEQLVAWLIIKGYPISGIRSFLRCGMESDREVLMVCPKPGYEYEMLIKARYTCSNRLCPRCIRRRQKKNLRVFLPIIKHYNENNKDNALSFRFLTISPPNYENLKEGIKDVRNKVQKYIRLKYLRERIKGGLITIEYKRSKDLKTWNIHAHIVYYGRRLENRIYGHCNACNQKLLKWDSLLNSFRCSRCYSLDCVKYQQDSIMVRLWKKSNKTEVNINVRDIKPYKGKGNKKYSSEELLLYYMNKVISYSTKDNGNNFKDMEDMAEYMVCSYKQNMISRFGIFHSKSKDNVKIPMLPLIDYYLDYPIFFYTDWEVIYQWKLKHNNQDGEPPPHTANFNPSIENWDDYEKRILERKQYTI